MSKASIRLFLVVAFSLTSVLLSYAEKSDAIKPRWLSHGVPLSKDGSSVFVKAHGEGLSLENARQMAMYNLTDQLQRKRSVSVSVESVMKESTYEHGSKGKSNYEYGQEIVLKVKEKGNEVSVICRTIDEYWKYSSRHYELDVLYVVPSTFYYGMDDINPNYYRPALATERVELKSSYPAAGFLSLIPGVGQMYKGAFVKGSLCLGLEIGAAAGILVSENNRASYKNKMVEQPKFAQQYQEKADRCETTRNICIGAAGAIYVWNLIDAFVTKGARRAVVKRTTSDGAPMFRMSPYTSTDGAGITMSYNF